MSTKTSFKRIALVAASALALGGFSVISAPQAFAGAGTCTAWTEFTAGKVSSPTLATVTAAPTKNTAVDVNFGAAIAAFITTANDAATCASQRFTGYLSSYPAGGFAPVTSTVATGTATKPTGANAADVSTLGSVDIQQTTSATGTSAFAAVTASATAGIGGFQFTPTKAGVYVLTVFNDSSLGLSNGSPDATEAIQTISITVVDTAAFSPSLSTAYAIDGNDGTPAGSSASDALGIQGIKTASRTGAVLATNVGAVTVTLLNTSGAATAGALTNTLTATLAGPGYVLWLATGTALPTADSCPAQGTANYGLRSMNLTATSSVNQVIVCGDGTSGTSKLTITATDVNGVVSTLATKTITFFGAVSKITATVNYTIGKAAGGLTGNSLAARVAGTTIPAVVVKATDSSGNVVSGLTIKAATSDSTVVNAVSAIGTTTTGGCIEDVAAALNTLSSGGAGFYNCSFQTPTSATSGKSATLTWRILDPADPLGVAYLTAPMTVTIGGSIVTETMVTDSASYSAGQAMLISFTAKDASGNPVADGLASPSVVANKALGGTAPLGTVLYVGGKAQSSTSIDTAGVFAPAVSGDFILTGTSSNAAGTEYKVTASVEGDASSSLALDAANAATDAANNAYDEAQNATQAASDALAAVTELAAQVTSLIASVKKLTAAVAKLSKKK